MHSKDNLISEIRERMEPALQTAKKNLEKVDDINKVIFFECPVQTLLGV